MKTISLNRLLLLLGTLFLLTVPVGCDKNEDDPDPEPVPTVISDSNFYLMMSNAITNCFLDVYNQNFAGKPTGKQNITVNGPMGGTVTITGTTAVASNGINTVDLLYDMNAIKVTYSAKDATTKESWVAEFTLTGDTTYKGSFNSTDYTSISHISQSLNIRGSVKFRETTRTIDQTGQISISKTFTRTSVNIFGYTNSWGS